MNATKTTAAAIATRARLNAITKLGRIFKCTPQKAEERMLRPNPKYAPYRVAFSNFVDEAITNVFAHVDNGHASLLPMHWAAVESPDANVESNPLGRMHGENVCYWVPNKAAA
jgi:hypothetical protein